MGPRTHRVEGRCHPPRRHGRELHRRLRLGVTYIHTHYREAIALRQVAAAAHMSSFHFLRTFRAVYGVTPSVYLNRKRTEAAMRLIRDSGWPLTEVAEHVGFGSRTTLYRQLRLARAGLLAARTG